MPSQDITSCCVFGYNICYQQQSSRKLVFSYKLSLDFLVNLVMQQILSTLFTKGTKINLFFLKYVCFRKEIGLEGFWSKK